MLVEYLQFLDLFPHIRSAFCFASTTFIFFLHSFRKYFQKLKRWQRDTGRRWPLFQWQERLNLFQIMCCISKMKKILWLIGLGSNFKRIMNQTHNFKSECPRIQLADDKGSLNYTSSLSCCMLERKKKKKVDLWQLHSFIIATRR